MPVIAALHGNCLGGGLQIALGADIRIAAPDARLSVMEVKWGLVPDMAITRTLPRLVGIDVAKELTYTGRVFSGAEAHELGLVTRVADDPLAAAASSRPRSRAGRRTPSARPSGCMTRAGPARADETLALEAELQLRADRLTEPAGRGRRRVDQAAGRVRRPVGPQPPAAARSLRPAQTTRGADHPLHRGMDSNHRSAVQSPRVLPLDDRANETVRLASPDPPEGRPNARNRTPTITDREPLPPHCLHLSLT